MLDIVMGSASAWKRGIMDSLLELESEMGDCLEMTGQSVKDTGVAGPRCVGMALLKTFC